jgi:signal transduction histidine kinase
MAKSKFILIALIFFSTICLCCSKVIVAQQKKSHKELIAIYNKTGNKLRYSYPDSALIYYQKSLSLSEQINDSNDIASVLNSISSVYTITNKYDSAILFLNKSIKISRSSDNKKGLASAYNSRGLLEIKREKLWDAKKYLFRAELISKQIGDSVLLSKIYNNLGLLYKRRHNYDSTLYYYHESLKIKETLKLKRVGTILNNIGLIYEEIGELDLALQYLHRALQKRKENKNRYGKAIVLNNLGLIYETKGEFEKALKYYQESFSIMAAIPRLSKMATLHNNMGSVYVKLKDFKKANEHLQKALDINIQINSKRGQIYSLLELGDFFENLEIYQNVIVNCNKALILLDSVNDMALTSEVYEKLYRSYQKLHHYDSALYFYKKYTLLNDSIFNTYSKRNIEKLEIEYQTLKKEKENQELIRENQIKEEKVKRSLLIVAVLFVILISVIIIGLFYIKSKIKLEQTYKLVLKQRDDIKRQSEELKTAYKKLQEFYNFKEELTGMIVHDIKNPLNVILNTATTNNIPNKDLIILNSGKKILNLVMNILDVYKYEEKILSLSRKRQYINLLLLRTKEDMAYIASEKNIKIQIVADYDFEVDIDESVFERILTNLLTNAIKFSSIGGVVTIKTESVISNKFILHIIDRGEGISPEHLDKIFNKFEQQKNKKFGYSGSTGLGLTFCKMAVESHGFNIGVTSSQGKGSDFFISLDYYKTKISDIEKDYDNKKEISISYENRKYLFEHILLLQKKDIFEVSDIKKIMRNIEKKNNEIVEYCNLIETSVLNCNQKMFDKLIDTILKG